MSPALASAFRLAQQVASRPRRVVLPAPEQLRAGLARRPAEQVPVTLQPISILRPVPEDPLELREFVLLQFPPAARRLAR
jgi:hypothetical protein